MCLSILVQLKEWKLKLVQAKSLKTQKRATTTTTKPYLVFMLISVMVHPQGSGQCFLSPLFHKKHIKLQKHYFFHTDFILK